MIPVNPEAIGLFGLFATVICFGLEQLGVGVKGADHEKLTLIPAWYTGKPALTKLAGLCNVAIGVISAFLLFPALFL